ncbi:hypothetical protein HC251_24255 [Iamia sp. SCSIO 61187]|uniref:glycosyltransferase family 39 protein n=1 Tax=Iamia sp. SCSIO 61187 TaxID=2722752 RepID=UPI001C62A4D8|nr:glycosyltransferase family 39 protein [Iamia sp. SCSIO 61187]QYG95235.1 hypothetical protein HC251_24255 [Iamia sp. SCSIO 61187]
MEATATRSRRGLVALVATVAVVAVAFLVAVAPWATDDFGYSLDGFNGAAWGLGARALADDPLDSRLGGVRPEGDRYANHPPLTVWSAAIGSAVSGDEPAAVRAPALLAGLLALAVLALLLHDAGLRPAATAAGVALAGTSGMFLTYGAMLDTPVVSLPFGLLALAAAQRVWQRRPPPTPALVAIGAVAALAGWQSALAAGLGGATCLLAAPGEGPSPRRGAVALGAGIAAGAAVTLGWAAWVHGGLRPLIDQAGFRSGVRRSDAAAGWLDRLGRHLDDLYGPAPVLAAIAVAVALGLVAGPGRADGTRWWRPAGLRPVLAVLVVTVVGYTLLFRNGAAVHDYWTYWGVALVGAGAAAVVQVLTADDRSPLARLPDGIRTGVVGVVVVALAVAGYGRQSGAETRIREGLDVIPVLEQVDRPDRPTQVVVAVRGSSGELPWVHHIVHGRAVTADDVASLRRLPPDLPVLVILRGPPSPALRALATDVDEDGRFLLVPAGDLLRHLGG